MNSLLRSPKVQKAVSAALAGYLNFVLKTLRWRREDNGILAEVAADPRAGLIVCFWHAGIPLSPGLRPEDATAYPEMRALISRSRDGAMIADVAERLGVKPIRGSRARDSRRTREKGGSEALREMVRWVKDGNGIALTPDGPRGPAETMGEGPALLARLTGVKVVLVGLASRPAIRIPSWDRTYVPLPFARAAAVYHGMPAAGPDDDMEALRGLWEAELRRVTRRAEAMLE